MGSLTSRVATRLSARPAATSTTFTPSGFTYDYAIGGLPFLGHLSKESPYGRKTAPYRKEQVDQTPIPGEQSMVFWWLRSQISFHGGTGVKFEEPSLDPTILYSDPLAAQSIPVRFQDSEGVDPWTQAGQVSLLPATALSKSASGNVILEGAVDGSGVDMWLQAETTVLTRCVDGSNAGVTWGGSGNIVALTQDGTNYYAADATGIYKGTLVGGAGSKIWNTGTGAVVMKWVKDRLVACVGRSVYELVTGGPALPTALFTPQIPNWTWTAIEEGPDSIFLAGYSGAISKVYSVSIGSNTGAVPILGVPVEVAALPVGEQVYSLKTVDGSLLAIGTNKGVRIADIGSQGRLQWGPLQFLTNNVPVLSITAYDRFLFCAVSNFMADGTSGLVRIDLGFQTQSQRFAYAKDLRAHVSGTVRSVVQYGASGRLVFSADAHGSYIQHATQLESSGYLKTGNIRFHTQEAKLFKYVRLQTAPLTAGTIVITVNDAGGGSSSIITLGTASNTSEEIAFPTLGPQEWVNLTFTLGRSAGDATKGPTFFSYQVKALPGQKNQRLVIVPVMLFDEEIDRDGNKGGYEGFAWERLQELEALEEARNNIMFQDLTTDETRLVVVDDLTFTQTDPPTRFSGFGGVAVVTLRTVT